MSATEYRRIAATQSTVREKILAANEPPQVSEQPRGPATIVPFPADRCRRRIDLELKSCRDYTPDTAYRHLNNVVRKQRSRLRAIGVDPDLVEADVRALADAFGIKGTC
jgi:hypothetical protein